MAEVLLFHHEHGLTPGIVEFADRLRAHGHEVYTPDLFAGRTFASMDEGMAYFDQMGIEVITARGLAVAETKLKGVPVFAGFSVGAIPAQVMAMFLEDAKGVLLFNTVVPLRSTGGRWPTGVPLQMHVNDAEGLSFIPEARELAQAVPGAEVFVYEAKGRIFADSSLPSYDKQDAEVLIERVLSFLEKVRARAADA